MAKAVVVCSGGIDSVTLAYHVAQTVRPYNLALISFDYGQKHAKELLYAEAIAERLGAAWHFVDLTSVTPLLTSALTTTGAVIPEGHYADENMKATVVPNRNAIMLSIAFGLAASMGAEAVYAGFHAGDHPIYPDCRAEFANAFETMERIALEGIASVSLITPFIASTKANIVSHGHQLEVPFVDTWSCYVGGELHCGKCGTCVERKIAFRDAGVIDPTMYVDTAYGMGFPS